MTVTPPDWEDIRRVYENTDLPVPKLCARFGISASMFRSARVSGLWTNRPSAIETAKARRAAIPDASNAASAIALVDPSVPADPPLTAAALATPDAAKPARKGKNTAAQRRAFVIRLTAAIETKLALLERRFAKELAASTSTGASAGASTGVSDSDSASASASASDRDRDRDKPTTSADAERDTRTIGLIIKNLEQVREYGHAPQPGLHLRGAAAKSVALAATQLADEADRIRRELGERLSRLVETTQEPTQPDSVSP